jgi:hypothetical protein
MKVQVTRKNFCSGVAAVSGSALAVLMGLVPADHLKDWQWLIIVLAVLAAIGSVVQMFLQSGEDRDLGRKIDALLAVTGREPTQPMIAGHMADENKPNATASLTEPDIDGEVYRLAMSPRSMAWEIVASLYKAKGREDEAV